MKFNIKIKESLYQDLKALLFAKIPEENGCFILGKQIGNNIILNEICVPTEMDLYTEEDLCAPTTSYIFKSSSRAKSLDKAIFFIHSHPNDWHPPHFSKLDLESNKNLLSNLSEYVPNAVGSIVMSKIGFTGICLFENTSYKIDKYIVLGDKLTIIKDLDNKGDLINPSIRNKYNRQLGFMTENEFSSIKELNIAIVGCGGIGSPLAVMLAKMGVGKLTLFDDDKIEVHNLPRIYGANESHIANYKADVVKEHIESFSECDVIVHKKKVQDDIEDFYNTDIIYGCLDNYKARAALNKFSVKLATPYIDSGCAIPLDDNGIIINAATSVVTVMPNKPCLWCAGILDGIKLREESLNLEELEFQQNEGYIKSIERAPSVISLTTSVASIAVNRLFNLLGIYESNIPMQTVYDFNNDKKFNYNHKKKAKCFCTHHSNL